MGQGAPEATWLVLFLIPDVSLSPSWEGGQSQGNPCLLLFEARTPSLLLPLSLCQSSSVSLSLSLSLTRTHTQSLKSRVALA